MTKLHSIIWFGTKHFEKWIVLYFKWYWEIIVVLFLQCNRYPLHYAYALPEEQGQPFIRLILEHDANEIENRVDKVSKWDRKQGRQGK